jgi:hypothetical protein
MNTHLRPSKLLYPQQEDISVLFYLTGHITSHDDTRKQTGHCTETRDRAGIKGIAIFFFYKIFCRNLFKMSLQTVSIV